MPMPHMPAWMLQALPALPALTNVRSKVLCLMASVNPVGNLVHPYTSLSSPNLLHQACGSRRAAANQPVASECGHRQAMLGL